MQDGITENGRLERELAEVKEERDRLKDALTAANEVVDEQKAKIRSQDKIVGDIREQMGYLRGQIDAETRAHRRAEEVWKEREKRWDTERGRWRKTLTGVALRKGPDGARSG